MSESSIIMEVVERSSDRNEKNLGQNEELIAYWRGLARDKRFHEVLAYAFSDLGPFSPGNTASNYPHTQTENNGGFKGAYMMVQKLLTGYRDGMMETKVKQNKTPPLSYDS